MPEVAVAVTGLVGLLHSTVWVKAVSRTMCSSESVVEVGRVRFGLDGGRDSCIHAGKCDNVTKAGVNTEKVCYTSKVFVLVL